MCQDVQYAARLMQRTPGSTLAAVATLGIGIAAALAIFTAVDRVLLRPLPYPDPDRLVHVVRAPLQMSKGPGNMLDPSFLELPVIAATGVWAQGGVNLDSGGDGVRLAAAVVDDGFFAVMGVDPLIGRGLPKADGDSRYAVLSYDLWRGHFNADRAIVGRTISLNRQTYTVTGVMRPGFVFPGRTDIWVPPMVDLQITGSAFAPEVVARLAPDVTLEQARQVVAIYDQTRRAAGSARGRSYGEALEIRPLGGALASRVRPTLLLLAASAALLLLVVCASVANLLLARVAARRHELTVRRALGASRWRVARQLLIESLLLSATGAAAGAILAAWALQGLAVLTPATLDTISIAAIDARFAATTIGVTIFTAVLFAVAPGLAAASHQASQIVRAGRQDLRPLLWRRVRSTLIIGQMAVALVLLTTSAAAVSALLEVTRIDPGFTGARALGMTVTLPYARFRKPATITEFFERAHERLVAVPGVRKVGATGFLPGSRDSSIGLEFTVPGRPRAEGAPRFFAGYLSASPDYFSVMGIRLIAGRSFTSADRAGAPHVIVLSESAARGLFPDGAAVGRRVDVDPRFATFSGGYEVIGVVADVRLQSLEADERSLRQAYVSLLQSPPFGNLSFVAEVDGRPEDSIAAITTAMRDVDPSIPIYSAHAIDDVIDRYFAAHRLAGTLVSGFAVVTLLVAAIGLYGLMAQLVTERTREIGIRMALGAVPHTVWRAVVRHGIAHAAAGAGIGALGASAALRVFGAVMPGLETPGAWTFMLNAAVLLGAALAATWIPASRVIRVDPIAALRE